jgi:UDP-arabinose 4-epimerase
MASILVTGGAGYVGSHCAKALVAAGHEGIVFDNLTFGHREFARWGPLIEGDIRDSAALDLLFNTHRIDAVMHFAALAYVGESVTMPSRYYDVNVNGTRVLLDAMVRAGVTLIVFSRAALSMASPTAFRSSRARGPIPSILMVSPSSSASA